MNKRQQKTLAEIYAQPIKRNLNWSKVVSLIEALGGKLEQGDGSRVRIVLGNQSLNIHTPHPGNELKPYQVRAIRALLQQQGFIA